MLSRRDYIKSPDMFLKQEIPQDPLSVFEIQFCVTQLTLLVNKIEFGEYFLPLFSADISYLIGSPLALAMLFSLGMMKRMIMSYKRLQIACVQCH